MTSIPHANRDIQQQVESNPPAVTHCRPTKIPVWTGYSSASASDCSDDETSRNKSIRKSQSRGAVSKLPVKIDVVPGSKSDIKALLKSGQQEANGSVNKASYSEEIEIEELRQVLPGILKQLLVEGIHGKGHGKKTLPVAMGKQDKPRRMNETPRRLPAYSNTRLPRKSKQSYQEADDITPQQADKTTNNCEDQLKRKIKQVVEELLTTSNETNKKCQATSRDRYTVNYQSQPGGSGEGCSRRAQGQGGCQSRQGDTTGGVGDDDPNDPRKPNKPRKQPDDKKDENDKQEKEKAAKKVKVNQMLGITNEDEPPCHNTIINNAIPVAELTGNASQISERESTEQLLKTIKSEDYEIEMIQGLAVTCCKDYEDLPGCFSGYTEDFKDDDELRAIIDSLNTDNSILTHENSRLKNKLYQITEEASEVRERNTAFSNKILRMEVDLEFLKAEKQELCEKVKHYTAGYPNEISESSVTTKPEAREDDHTADSLDHYLGKVCSLQNVEVIKIEEENQVLKGKLEQYESTLKIQRKENSELKDKLAKQKSNKSELESRIEKLLEENDILHSKCSEIHKQSSQIPLEEIVRDLRRLHAEILEAREDLGNDRLDTEPEGSVSRPLSAELAEADDCSLHLQPQPDVNPASELHILTYSITALTEELRQQITTSKVKLAKTFCNNDYVELEKRSHEKIKELTEEIAGLHEKLEEDCDKFKAMETMIEQSDLRGDRLNEWVEELQQELEKNETILNKEIIDRDEKLENIKRDMEMKDQQLKEVTNEYGELMEATEEHRKVICTINENNITNCRKIQELQSYIRELESENANIYQQLHEQKANVQKMQRKNDENMAFARDEMQHLHDTLQNKTELLVDVLVTVDKIASNHPTYHEHPCRLAIENGLQIVYEVTSLLKGTWKTYSPSTATHNYGKNHLPQPSTREQELEFLLENLQEENKNLQDENRWLECKLDETEARFLDDKTGNAENMAVGVDKLYTLLDATQNWLRDRETELEKIRANVNRNSEDVINSNETVRREQIQKLQELVHELNERVQKYESIFDNGREHKYVRSIGQQSEGADGKKREIDLVRQSSSDFTIEWEKQLKDRQDSELELQQRADALRLKADQFKAEKIERDKKIQELIDSIHAKQNLTENSLITQENERLKDKLSKVEIAFSELKNEKENAARNAQSKLTQIRNDSQEQIAGLEEWLNDLGNSETKLENRVFFLEARISHLTDEKEVNEEKIKTLLEALNARKHQEEHLKKKEDEEKQLVQKVNILRLRLLKVKAAKNNLRRQLEKMRLANHLTSTASRKQLQHFKNNLEECAERERELNDRITMLSEEREKTEEILKEREARVELIEKASEEKMQDLEKLLRCKSYSEVELQEQKTSLEQEIVRLEEERVEHNRIISAILRTVKAKEELAKAIKAKDSVEREYSHKLNEIEILVDKLREEKDKPKCDVNLKEKYKDRYYKLCMTLRKLGENLENHTDRVKELQTLVLTATEEENKTGETRTSDLHQSMEALQSGLKSTNAYDIQLYSSLQSLSSKILALENEKADGEKMIKALLKSMEDNEDDQHGTSPETHTEKTFLGLICEVVRSVHKLRHDKLRIETDLEKFEKMMATARSETDVLQNQSCQRISDLEQSLKERFMSETDLQERLKSMDHEIACLQSEKQKANITIQTMLESTKSKDELEERLQEKEEIEKDLKQKVRQLQKEKQQVEIQAKKSQIRSSDEQKSLKLQIRDLEACLEETANKSLNDLAHEIERLNTNLAAAETECKLFEARKDEAQTSIHCEQELRKQLGDAEEAILELLRDNQIMKAELRQIKFEKAEASNAYLDKIKVVTDTLQHQYDEEKELRKVIDSLSKQTNEIQEEKEAIMEENRKTVESLNRELEIQSTRETEIKQQVKDLEEERSQLRMEIGNLVKCEADMREERDSEKEKLESEFAAMAENMEEKIMCQKSRIDELQAEVETANLERHKLLVEIEELQADNFATTRNSRKFFEELTRSKNELVEKVDELKSGLNALEEENKKLTMESKNYQSEVSKLTLTSRDAVFKLQKDLESERESNKSLQDQIGEMKSVQLSYSTEIKEHSPKKQQDREEALKQQIKEMKKKIAELEDQNYECHAKNKRKQFELVSESKRAKAKIGDLDMQLKQKIQFEAHLMKDIESLNGKISDMCTAIKNEKVKNTEMEKVCSLSKARIAELENNIGYKQEQIENLRRSCEELRGQIFRLREEKDYIGSALDDNYRLMLEQKDMEIKLLKNKLNDQGDKMKANVRRTNDEILRDQVLIDTRRGAMMKESEGDHRQTTKVIMDSLNDSERRISKLKSSWQYLEDLQKRFLKNTSQSVYRNATYNIGGYKPSTAYSSTLV